MNKEVELLREFYQEVQARGSYSHNPRLIRIVELIEAFDESVLTVTRVLTYTGKASDVEKILRSRTVIGSYKVPSHDVVITEEIEDLKVSFWEQG